MPRYLSCETITLSFGLGGRRGGDLNGLGARLRTARFFALQCSPPVSAVQRQCSLHSSVPQSAVVSAQSVPPSCPPTAVSARSVRSSVLSTVSAVQHQCPFRSSVPPHPQSAVHRQCLLCSSVPQSALHHQCPLRAPVPQSAVHRQLVGKPTSS